MRPSFYLYKDLPPYLAYMPYKWALEHKIKAANKLLEDLLKEHYGTRDTLRINAILKAIKFNQGLIDELQKGVTNEGQH